MCSHSLKLIVSVGLCLLIFPALVRLANFEFVQIPTTCPFRT